MSRQSPVFNLVVNHIAVSVPDCEAAVDWYTSILGFRKLRKAPRMTDKAITPNAPLFKIYGDELQQVKVAFLTTGNGVGFELFEFINPRNKELASFDYTRGGYYHIAVTHPDPEMLCEMVLAAGGRKIGVTVTVFDDEKALYIQDPWGNTVEILSCSLEMLMANRAQDPGA